MLTCPHHPALTAWGDPDHYDRDATTAIRYGHLVDATECAEIAMTHLGQLKAAMNHRLRVEDERHGGETPF